MSSRLRMTAFVVGVLLSLAGMAPAAGVRDTADDGLGGHAMRTPWTVNEGYSMLFENRWRVNVLGVPSNDLQMWYTLPGDVLHSPDIPLFP